MLNKIIDFKRREWLQSTNCPVKGLLKYMRSKGKLRKTQIEAIETYLFLKIKGQNKPLWELFSEGFFTNIDDLESLNINQKARKYLSKNPAALALFDFSRQENNNTSQLASLRERILDEPDSLNYKQIIKNIFYDVDYADYLMSLPMGAGKTYLMAAFIYLDLYFANNEPENKIFAHNFLLLIPSGLKSSIVPSLKTVENFDPTWVVPDPAASELKRKLKFQILDEHKTAKKSNRARNPNAQKVNQCLPNPFGQVFVVNAEKVILNRINIESGNGTLKIEFPESDDERDKRENELRNLIGKIPNLSLFIDEVHHAAKSDIKLRQVVNKWAETKNIRTVLGFSGTPYLPKDDKIKVDDSSIIKFSKITNTVYYYPLTLAIQSFLKTPKVKIGKNLDRFQIIRRGIEDFQEEFGEKIYGNGTVAKIAIYCSNIRVLEEEVYPFLTGELGIDHDEILKFHKGNRKFPQPEKSELEFRSLDLPISTKKYILLVQVGKEGWNCKSLAGIILSQKGDCPKNMVLQTSCRCLRQVDPNEDEKALIWLNEYNAKTLNDQLKLEQHTSIAEINELKKEGDIETINRFSRIDYLNLPKIDFYQLQVKYQSIEKEKHANTREKLNNLANDLDKFKDPALVTTTDIGNLDSGEIAIMHNAGTNIADYNQWIFDIGKESFGLIKSSQLYNFENQLRIIFDHITYQENGTTYWNDLFDLYSINSQIRLSFSLKRSLSNSSEIIPQDASILLVDKLNHVEKNKKLYPGKKDVEKILELDKSGEAIDTNQEKIQKDYKKAKLILEQQQMGHMMPSFESYKSKYVHSQVVSNKDRSFHYLPYNFIHSGFEKDIIQKILQLENFKKNGLEVYYNGERGLTEFVIKCFIKKGKIWKNIGLYTTDFLIIKRDDDNSIHKVLLIETKGEGFKSDPTFIKKRNFVESKFLNQNNVKFGYDRFDFLYLEDGVELATNIVTISNKIDEFFKN